MLQNKGLVKTRKFRNPIYIGDPINAVRIFNDLEADELVFLDITASKGKRTVSCKLVKKIGDEAFMPFAVGGGITTVNQIRDILKAGAEKIVLNTSAILIPQLIKNAAQLFGNQSIIISIDVKKNIFGKYKVFIKGGSKKTNISPVELAKNCEKLGAGELLINSIDQDGIMGGYDTDLIKMVSNSVDIPVIACGGAGNYKDFNTAVYKGGAHAVAAGSMFVFHGPRRGVLINYPTKKDLIEVFKLNNHDRK